MINLGLCDRYIEEYISPEEFTNLLVKIIGIYSIHIAIMLAGFFNMKGLVAGGESLIGDQKAAALIIIVLSVCWNIMMGITITNFNQHVYIPKAAIHTDTMFYSDFTKRIDLVSGAINFLVAGGLAYFFNKKED